MTGVELLYPCFEKVGWGYSGLHLYMLLGYGIVLEDHDFWFENYM